MASIALLKAIDRLLGPPLARLTAFRNASPVQSRPAQARPVLVIRPGGLGDAVLLLPPLRALRAVLAPEVRIDILCEPRNRAAFDMAALPNTRVLLYTERPWSLRRRLRRAGYETVIDSEQSHWFSAIFAAWTRAPVRIGFDTLSRRARLYTHAVPYGPPGPERERFQRLFATVGGCGGPPLSLAGGRGGTPPSLAILHIGGSNPSKHWPPERYAALCDALHSRHGLRPVLVGSAADRPAANRIASLCRAAAPENRVGALSLPEVSALCATAAVFIGPDSGIAHLAEAAGAYAIVLFGSADPVQWGPAPGRGAAVTAPGACPAAPCARFGTLLRRRGCRYECIRSIPVEAVLAALPHGHAHA